MCQIKTQFRFGMRTATAMSWLSPVSLHCVPAPIRSPGRQSPATSVPRRTRYGPGDYSLKKKAAVSMRVCDECFTQRRPASRDGPVRSSCGNPSMCTATDRYCYGDPSARAPCLSSGGTAANRRHRLQQADRATVLRRSCRWPASRVYRSRLPSEDACCLTSGLPRSILCRNLRPQRPEFPGTASQCRPVFFIIISYNYRESRRVFT